MRHLVEIWETTGPRGTLHTATCLACGWYGEGRELRPVAEAEGRAHVAAESARIVPPRPAGGAPRRSPDPGRRPQAG